MLLYNSFMTMGTNIRRARITAGLDSQRKLAKALKVTIQAVSEWERDVSQPETKRLQALAKACKTTVDRLIDGQPGLSRDEQEALELLGRMMPQDRERWLKALRAFLSE